MDYDEDNAIAEKVRQTSQFQNHLISLQDGIDFYKKWQALTSDTAEKLEKGWKKNESLHKRSDNGD